MSVIPCSRNDNLRKLIEEYSETLKTEAHKLGNHGLDEKTFYESGLFLGAIQRIRGQTSATMGPKREFAAHVLNHMQDRGFVKNWEPAGGENRHDYTVWLPSGRVSVIELKGCMDGNNTIIYERPSHAQEFVIWSLCTNEGADPQLNAWSGIHTRIGADIIAREQRVDGVIIWDMICGTVGRPCPKLVGAQQRLTVVAHYQLPPPCVYVLPATAGNARTNPKPVAQSLDDVLLLKAFHDCFLGLPEEVNYVDFEVEYRGTNTVRRTTIRRAGAIVKASRLTAIKR